MKWIVRTIMLVSMISSGFLLARLGGGPRDVQDVVRTIQQQGIEGLRQTPHEFHPHEIGVRGEHVERVRAKVYDVDGVRTFVGGPATVDREPSERRQPASVPKAILGDKVLANPLHAYSTEAMDELKDTLEAAKKQQEEKAKVLKQLSNQ